jgi:hypothetical protein
LQSIGVLVMMVVGGGLGGGLNKNGEAVGVTGVMGVNDVTGVIGVTGVTGVTGVSWVTGLTGVTFNSGVVIRVAVTTGKLAKGGDACGTTTRIFFSFSSSFLCLLSPFFFGRLHR